MATASAATIVDLQLVRDAANPPKTETPSHLQLDRDAHLSKASRLTANRAGTANRDPHNYEIRRAECVSDCMRVLAGTVTRTALRQKYEAEYNSHRNMLQREKTLGRKVTPEWRDFAQCLMAVGPSPGPGYTLDRLDNDDPEYAPGKVAWRNKRDQANNRASTTFLEIDGERQPATIWARRSGTPADTIRKRLREGWSHREAIYGRQRPNRSSVALCWPGEHAAEWEARFQASGTECCRLDWLTQVLSRAKRDVEHRLTAILGDDIWYADVDDPAYVEPQVPPEHTEEVARLWARHRIIDNRFWFVAELRMAAHAGRLADRAFWHGFTERRPTRLQQQGMGRRDWRRDDAPNPDGFGFPQDSDDDGQ